MTSGSRRLPRRRLGRYRDPKGREHELWLVERPGAALLLDCCRAPLTLPLVVAELGEGEGLAEARAVLDGSADALGELEGYLERAARCERPLCRRLERGELTATVAAEEDGQAGESEIGLAA